VHKWVPANLQNTDAFHPGRGVMLLGASSYRNINQI